MRFEAGTERAAGPAQRPSRPARSNSDYNSRELLVKILDGEEEHIYFLEAQFELIKRMGLENYVQLQSKAAE